MTAQHMDEARITSYRDGPLLVRGPFRLEDQDGNPIDAPGPGTIALCRCGKSRMRPFCDGSTSSCGFARRAARNQDAAADGVPAESSLRSAPARCAAS